MNHDLEERLGQHLAPQGSIEHDAGQLAGVRRLARRRSLRNRVATGIVGLAALAGLGSLVPTGTEPNALITATEPTEVPEPTVEPEDAPLQSEFVDPPVFLALVGDGRGGFVGADKLDRDTVQFLRSDDGENWRLAETWAIPEGTRFETFSFADGLFIAQLEQPEPDTFEYGLLSDPLLAISPDLQSWDYVDLELAPDPGAGGSVPTVDTLEQQVKYRIDNFVRNDDKLAMLVHTAPQFDARTYELFQNEVCGQIDRPIGVTLVLCDGGFQELPAGHFGRSLFGTETRVFVTDNGAPAGVLDIEVPPLGIFDGISIGSGHALIAEDDGFRALTPGEGLSDLLPAEFLQGELEATVVSAHRGTGGETLIVARIAEALVPIRVTKVGANFEVTSGSFPSSVPQHSASEMVVMPLGHGPAGWVVAVASFEDTLVTGEQNGWIFGSYRGAPSAVLRSADHDETIVFSANYAALPPHVHVSLFGGVRYLHPETGEVLVELSASQALIPEPWAAIEDQIGLDRSLVIDGWKLTGNPVAGPLTLTSPDGTEREFADGFAFDNDDISDGVEADFSNRSFIQGMVYGAGDIVFYDDQGNELVTIQSHKIIAEFITPVVGEADHFEALVSDPFGEPPVSILYSSNGIEWNVLVATDGDADPFLQSVAVGDDEIVTGLVPRELHRHPLED